MGDCAPLVTRPPASKPRPLIIQGVDLDSVGPDPTLSTPPTKTEEEKCKEWVAKRTLLREEQLSYIRDGVLSTAGRFSDSYFPALAKMFGMEATKVKYKKARQWLKQCLTEILMLEDDRYFLGKKFMVPYYWIEPTTITGSKDSEGKSAAY